LALASLLLLIWNQLMNSKLAQPGTSKARRALRAAGAMRRQAVLVALALVTLACGDESGPAGSEPMAAGGNAGTTEQSGSGGAADTSGESAGSGGPAGGGAASGGSASAGTCDDGSCGSCSPWPDGCEVTCEVPIGVCLLDADGASPTESLRLEAEVTAVGVAPWPCLSTPAIDDATTVSLTDSAGETWSLAFPTEMVEPDRFAGGAQLVIEFTAIRPPEVFAFHDGQRLTVSEQGELLAFVFTEAQSTLDVSAAGLTFELGEMACPHSPPDTVGCSRTRFHTVAHGPESVTDPCGTRVGDMLVSSLFHGAGSAPLDCGGLRGFCDSVDTFVAGGVRIR
jgi:hypothetical protein